MIVSPPGSLRDDTAADLLQSHMFPVAKLAILISQTMIKLENHVPDGSIDVGSRSSIRTSDLMFAEFGKD